MQSFVFTSDVDSLRGRSRRILEIPAELPDKVTLLLWYATALDLPDYFGANWDALNDCLRDLSWVKEHTVVLYHQDVPLAANPRDRKTYVEILANAASDWKPGEAHELIVAFNPACKSVLKAAIHER